jgi:branched-chain amino acid transport system ATP-binding protein
MTRVVLEARGVTKQIGGLTALKGVDLRVHEDEILGLVGPNGAGKTTLLNIISGVVPATAGTVSFLGEVITGLPPHAICRKGIAQTFQLAQSFPSLTALESVTASAIFGNHEPKVMADAAHEAENHLEFVGFPLEKGGTPVRNLNVVELKRVQLARALASRPTLLLLDELTTGLNPKESNDAIGLIREIRKQGISILIIEHVMRVIMGVSDRIVVLDKGEKIAEGKPYEVANNQRVIDTYLGDMYAL